MSDQLFGRKWKVTIYKTNKTNDTTELDVSELRCVFEIEKVALSIANYGVISIYNLASATENMILNEGSTVTIEAGYQNYYTVENGKESVNVASQYGHVFTGNIMQIIRTREDNLDYVLKLVCLDGDSFLSDNFVAFSLNKGQNPRKIIESIASKSNVTTEIGRISPDLPSQTYPRGKVMFGDPKKYIRTIAKGNNCDFFIDNGKIHVERATDTAPGEALVLTPQTGLIGTPQQTQEGIEFKCLLNPKIQLKSMVKLDNSYIRQQQFEIGQCPMILDEDGQYQAYKVTHKGDNRGTDWYTQVVGISRYGKVPLLLGSAGQSPW